MRKFRIFGSLMLAVLLASTSTFAQSSGKLPPINVKEYKLKNGLTVIMHQDRSTPIVAVNLWYHVGSKNEAPGRTGFAHLFEHMMFQGSKNFVDGWRGVDLAGMRAMLSNEENARADRFLFERDRTRFLRVHAAVRSRSRA